MKNNILHTKGIMNCYSQKYIDHNLFKQTLSNNNKPDKISFNNISVKNQNISTNKIINKCWSHIAPFSRLYLVKLKVVVQLKSQQ